MDIKRILVELKKQRSAIDTAIAALEHINPSAENAARARLRARSRRKTSTQKIGSQETLGKLIPFRRVRKRRQAASEAEQA